MFDIWRIRQARRAAVESIRPFVEASRYRLNGISEGVWHEPYMVGFLSTLVTLAAQRRVATLRTQAMGVVQADAWADITNSRPDLIGEEICFHSAGRSRDFEIGCHNALRFFNALYGTPPGGGCDPSSLGLPPPEEGDAMSASEPYGDVGALWSDYFEAHIQRAQLRAPGRNEL